MTVAATCEESYICEVRRVPTPICDPPYDDEVVTPAQLLTAETGVQGSLALAFHLPGGLPAVPVTPLRVVPDPEDDPGFFEPQATPAATLPDPRPFTFRLVQAVLEVVVAARPVGQLVRWTTEDVYRQLVRRVRLAGHEDVTRRRQRAPGRVRSVHVSEPRGNAVEACAIVQHQQRATAVALRLEGVDGHWRCTALQLG